MELDMQMQNNVADLFMHRMAKTSELLASAAQEAIDIGDHTLTKLGELAMYRDRMRAKARALRDGTFVADGQ